METGVQDMNEAWIPRTPIYFEYLVFPISFVDPYLIWIKFIIGSGIRIQPGWKKNSKISCFTELGFISKRLEA